jgi:5-methylcytosine-specific restriction endonuclease McrA
MNILLLNATYEPLTVLSRARAMALWLRGRVEAATEDKVMVRGVSHDFALPTVMRLRRYVNVPRRGAKWHRLGVLQRDGYRCIYCGIHVGERQDGRTLTHKAFTVDHIVPKSKGGHNTWGNTACACGKCNSRKGARTPHEAGLKLLWEPKTPRVNYLIASGDLPDAWKVYLEY